MMVLKMLPDPSLGAIDDTCNSGLLKVKINLTRVANEQRGMLNN